MSLSTYSTLSKANHGKAVDHTVYRYIDKVHVVIKFDDTLAVGGTRYVLIFVGCATRYNYVLILKSLSSTDICEGLNLFRSQTRRFVKYFHADYNEKLFGQANKSYLTENDSDINRGRR